MTTLQIDAEKVHLGLQDKQVTKNCVVDTLGGNFYGIADWYYGRKLIIYRKFR